MDNIIGTLAYKEALAACGYSIIKTDELTRLQAIEAAAMEWAEEPENEWFDGLCKCGACALHRALDKKTPA